MDEQQDILVQVPERQHNGKRVTAAIAALLLAVPVAGFATPAAAPEHRYTVTVDAGLDRLEVVAEFARPAGQVRARSRRAADFLVAAADCRSGRQLAPDGRRLRLTGAAANCLRYTVDIGKAARSGSQAFRPDAGSVVVPPAYWLWRPELGPEERLSLRFDLPDGMRAAVPWPEAASGSTYLLERSPQSGRATAVFGHVDSRTLALGGTEIRVTFLGEMPAERTTALAGWILETAANVTRVYGRFPTPLVSVYLVPADGRRWRDDSAVPFGRVVRDGGEAIELWINPDRPLDEFRDAWTPTHEFAHLLLPYLDRRQRWISEGFATYYQNLLLARAGRYTEERAWEKLSAGFDRGRRSAPALSPNAAATADERSTRMKVYWSGAAIALLADVELRQRSGNRESLDTVLDDLAGCCLPSSATWSGPAFFARLDSLLDEPLFTGLYRRWADSPGFPAVDDVLRELGVVVQPGSVRFDDAAPLAGIRRAMTAAPAAPGP